MTAIRIVGYLKILIFNWGSKVNMHHRAKFCSNLSNHCWDTAIFRFDKMVVICHLGLVVLDHWLRVLGGVYHCAKFGWNRFSSFNTMQALMFNKSGSKMPITPTKRWFSGFDLLNWQQPHCDSQKAPPCTETQSLISVYLFCTTHHFTKPPKSYASQCFSMGQTPPKCPISLGHQHHHVMHGSLDPSDSASQIVSQSVQLFLHSSWNRVPVLNNGPPLFCLKIAPSCGGSEPHVIRGSGPPESTSQMASRSVQLFLQGSQSWQTNRPCYFICNTRPHLHSTAMQPKNGKDKKANIRQRRGIFLCNVSLANWTAITLAGHRIAVHMTSPVALPVSITFNITMSLCNNIHMLIIFNFVLH